LSPKPFPAFSLPLIYLLVSATCLGSVAVCSELLVRGAEEEALCSLQQ
jgi:hypothetical protein